MAEADRVHIEEPGVLLQRAERAVAEVDDKAEPFRLEQVTGCGAVRRGKTPGATHHGKTHASHSAPQGALGGRAVPPGGGVVPPPGKLSPELALESFLSIFERAAVGARGQVLPAAVRDQDRDVG